MNNAQTKEGSQGDAELARLLGDRRYERYDAQGYGQAVLRGQYGAEAFMDGVPRPGYVQQPGMVADLGGQMLNLMNQQPQQPTNVAPGDYRA